MNTNEKIRQFAEQNPDMEEVMKEKFPEAFESEYFDFGDQCKLSRYPDESINCLFIGNGLAPRGLEFKCLVVKKGWDLETEELNGRTILKFHRK